MPQSHFNSHSLSYDLFDAPIQINRVIRYSPALIKKNQLNTPAITQAISPINDKTVRAV